jgi:streptomycin 6-kinase
VITDLLRRNVIGAWGAAGERWLADLPRVLDQTARDWHLTVGEPFHLTYHYAAEATTADGTPAVLKLGVPTGDSLRAEVPALRAFAGRGAVRLLRADLGRGAVLLERAEPGDRLRDLVPHDDTEATSIAVDVMKELAQAAPTDDLPDLVTQARAFDRYPPSPLPADLVRRAGGLMRELCADAPARVVLHGDLHHDNILRATRGECLAIDPHGLVGDPGHEIGSLLFNPDPHDRDPALLALVPARVEQLADGLAMPVERVLAWGFVKAVLSDVWRAQDWTPGAADPTSRALDVANLLLPRLPE